METKKLIGAAAFSLALAGGGVAGAILGTPGTSGAQEATTTTEPAADATAGTPPRADRHAELVDAAAEALGMTGDELRAELEAGKTIADVAGEKGVDVQTVIDAVVAAGQDDLVERATAFVNGEAPEGRGPGGFGRGGRRGGPRLDAAAEALGMTPAELRTALAVEGTSLADVAAAQGVDVQAVIDALVAEAQTRLDAEVAEGELTQAEADARKAEVTDRITAMVNSDAPAPGSHAEDGEEGEAGTPDHDEAAEED